MSLEGPTFKQGERACDTVVTLGEESGAKPGSWVLPSTITQDEWTTARPAPDCIVQDYLFADVCVLIAPGGVGKTTLTLYEAAHIVLGKPLYGLRVIKSGPVVLITAEDGREMLVARLRSICAELGATAAELEIIRTQLRISDVSGNGLKLTAVVADVVLPNLTVDEIIDACRELSPVLIVIDPAVSFSVGESRVNDAEQGLVEAARRMRRALNCCVRYVHHTGKQNARDGAVDQYAGRGGSAFADGARMVHVLQAMLPCDWQKATGTDLSNGETGVRLARPKMSYCAPQTDIFIRRAGYRFVRVDRIEQNQGAELAARANQVWQLLDSEVKQGHRPTKNSLEGMSKRIGLTRSEIRDAVAQLESAGRVERHDCPSQGKGGLRTYLHPVIAPDHFRRPNGEPSEISDNCHAHENTVIASPPSIGKTPAAHLNASPGTFLSYGSPELTGDPMATLAKQSDLGQEFSTIEVEL